jgi:hypothetical protein
MRRLSTSVWHILKRQTIYQFHYEPINSKEKKVKSKRTSKKKTIDAVKTKLPPPESKKPCSVSFLRHNNNADGDKKIQTKEKTLKANQTSKKKTADATKTKSPAKD